MRYEKSTWRMETLVTGMVLVSALATQIGVTSIRAAAGSYSARTVVDAVSLAVRSPALPAVAFVASRPGNVLQGAAAVTNVPYRAFTIYAYPYGSAAPMSGVGIVEPQHLREYRAAGTGRLIRFVRPTAMIFGHRVVGSARTLEVALGPRRQATEVVSWLTDAGGRLWVIQAAEPRLSNRGAEEAFATGTSVTAVNISAPTTVPGSDLIQPGPAAPVTQRVILVAASATDPPPVRFPPWWSGNCDSADDPGSFPLSSWDGLTACGPGVNRGGWDRTVAFFPHAWGQYEWECVELSMRWLYLEYGVRPYPANGSEVVADYSPADGGDLLKMANDGTSVPEPGDVLSMEPTWDEGHTAVVTAADVTSGNGTIDVLEQNMDGGNGTNTLGVIDGVVQPDDGMPVTGWLQAQPSSTLASPGVRDAVLVNDAGFAHLDGSGWQTSHSRLKIEPAGKLFTSTSVVGGGVYQDISFPVRAGESFCADAEVVTAASRSGARGAMTLRLLGVSRSQESSVVFGPLPGKNQWTHVSTCVTASQPHSVLRIRFSDAPTAARLGIDAVDVHQSLVVDGGFDEPGSGGWQSASESWFGIELGAKLATKPYEGKGFAFTGTSSSGGGIYQDIFLATRAGDSLCADAEVVTAAAHPGARGHMSLRLLGESRNDSSSVNFGPLGGRNQWTHVSTCVTATGPHSEIRVQFYDVPKAPRLGVDAVDLYQSFVDNGGFNRRDGNGWRTTSYTHFAIMPAGKLVTSQYEGNGFGVVSASALGGGIYQDISLPTSAGESFCADAEVVTAAARSGARGQMTIWLYGDSTSQSSSVSFGPLPGRNQWTHVSTCITATRLHSGIRIRFYDVPRTPRLGVDAVEVR
ncbi:MAG: CHAP domain-containing protein [Acidimicrobiales bacterium]